jgi:hypothetical protein
MPTTPVVVRLALNGDQAITDIRAGVIATQR